MAKYGSGSFSILLSDGYNLLGAKVQNFSSKTESITEPSHGLGDTNQSNSPVGMKKATLNQDGAFFDDLANGMHAAMKASTGVSRILCYAVAGNVIGQPFTGCQGEYASTYEVLVQSEKLTKANAGYVISGQVDDGVIVQNWTQKTVDWNTKTDGSPVDYTLDPSQRVIPITSNSIANPSVVTTPVAHGLATGDIILIAGVTGSTPTINGERVVTVLSPTTFSVPVNVTVAGTGGTFVRSNSSGGAVGYQQVSEFTGFTGFVGKLRDSPDNITYADLITFANVTAAPAAERQVVAGVIDRWLSYDGNVSGSGTITPFAGLSRT
jgi:hypothetical protein